jgi:MOSC domain-containing protein YiiM
MHVRQIFISPGHNFIGHHGRPAGENAISEVGEVECVAGQGLRGDRFFGHRPDYKGQVTFFAAEVLAALRDVFGLEHLSAAAFRRNVVSEGVDLNALVGTRFRLQGIEFEAVEECRPCYWMNQAIGDGAEEWLKGRGGLRCRILSSGWLRTEPA